MKGTEVIKESFIQYSGAVLQSRALVYVRDCLKPSARQIFYCMETDGFTGNKPFRKTLKAIGSAMRLYIHGDSSCEGVIMRAGQPFAMRYPLVEVEGSYGTLTDSGNWSAPRYTAARLSPLMDTMFVDIKKDTITEWRDNYDDTEQYPAVLPSKGFYNLCNGSMGIGVGASSSIPQFNLTELNNALIKLLLNPDVAPQDLVILPDFATGCTLLNPEAVKQSLIEGHGDSCRLRATTHYDQKDNAIVVTEVPYGVYTSTICGEINKIIEEESNPGIERVNDLTGSTPLIKIYLMKKANPAAVLAYLYKNTSLESWYAINFTMLDQGRFPKVFGWKETLQAHIDHEKEVYRRGFEFDIHKAEARIHILDGLIIAIANIDEVVAVIKGAVTVDAARKGLISKFLLDDVQAKAVLDTKLSRLAHLEVEKLEKERIELLDLVANLQTILTTPALFNEELVKGWRLTAKKYGDARRTKIMDMPEPDDTTPVPTKEAEKRLYLVLENNSVLAVAPEDKINLTKKGNILTKQKVRFGFIAKEDEIRLAVDAQGRYARVDLSTFTLNVEVALPLDNIIQIIPIPSDGYVVTLSRKGVGKKTSVNDYNNFKRSSTFCKVREDDSLLYVGCCAETDYLVALTKHNTMVKLPVASITTSGKATIGSKLVGDEVVCAAIASEKDVLFTVQDGKYKATKVTDYSISPIGSKGQMVSTNTTTFVVAPQGVYVVDDNKISFMTCPSCKGKDAMGAKLSENPNLKLVAQS